jgi:hypothetical protein
VLVEYKFVYVVYVIVLLTVSVIAPLGLSLIGGVNVVNDQVEQPVGSPTEFLGTIFQ